MTYCRECGSEETRRIANGNYKDDIPVSSSNAYKYEITCAKGHVSYSNRPDKVPEGMVAVRCVAPNGYQTAHVNKEFAPKFKDKDWFAVGLLNN